MVQVLEVALIFFHARMMFLSARAVQRKHCKLNKYYNIAEEQNLYHLNLQQNKDIVKVFDVQRNEHMLEISKSYLVCEHCIENNFGLVV